MTKEETKKENVKLIADAVREALHTIASEKIDAKRVIATDAEKAVQVIATQKETDSGSFTNILYKQISFGLSVFAVVFGAFIYLTSPTQENDTALQLQDQRITSQQKIIDDITKTQQNDTQELKLLTTQQTTEITSLKLSVEKLTTIIAERIPAKK